jgi:hypothetical protein
MGGIAVLLVAVLIIAVYWSEINVMQIFKILHIRTYDAQYA